MDNCESKRNLKAFERGLARAIAEFREEKRKERQAINKKVS